MSDEVHLGQLMRLVMWMGILSRGDTIYCCDESVTMTSKPQNADLSKTVFLESFSCLTVNLPQSLLILLQFFY